MFTQALACIENTGISLSFTHLHTHTRAQTHAHTHTFTGCLAEAAHMVIRDTLGKVGRGTVTFDSQNTIP